MTLEDNKQLVRRLVDEAVNARDLDVLDEVADGEIATAARRWIGPFRESFPDFTMEVVELIAEDDKVVGHFKCSGTHEGEWRGRPPTGRRFEAIDEIYLFRIHNGRLTGTTAIVEDNLTRMKQLGSNSERRPRRLFARPRFGKPDRLGARASPSITERNSPMCSCPAQRAALRRPARKPRRSGRAAVSGAQASRRARTRRG